MKTQKDDLALAHLSLKKPYYVPGPFLWLVRRTGQALPQSPVSNLGQHSTSFSESSWSGALEIGFRHTAAPSANPEGLAPGADYSAAPEVRRALPASSLRSVHPLADVYGFVSVLPCHWLLAARPPGSADIALGVLVVASEVSGVGARAEGVCQRRCSAA